MTARMKRIVFALALLVLTAASTGFAAGPQRSDFQQLEGSWVRPDGGYVLALKDIKPDGSLTAAYYNPRSIRVYRAKAGKENGKIALAVELRDVNYPGSKYNLIYDPSADRLRGAYFQAIEKKSFIVEFIRAR